MRGVGIGTCFECSTAVNLLSQSSSTIFDTTSAYAADKTT
jgi:hypothetical protein